MGAEGLTGLAAMELSVAAVTVRVSSGLVTPPRVAVMTVVPTPRAVARPREPSALEMVATAGVADAHVTCDVRSCVVPSVYVPVAMNWTVVPLAVVGFTGLTAMELSVAAVTTSVAAGLVTYRASP